MFVSFLCTLIIFLLAIVIALFCIIAFARILCSRAILRVYVFLVLFSFLFCLQLFSCAPARCSNIPISEIFKDFSIKTLTFSFSLYSDNISEDLHRLLKLWKSFHCLWEFYYPWILDLRKWFSRSIEKTTNDVKHK